MSLMISMIFLTIHDWWLQVCSLTPRKVALSSRGPEEPYCSINHSLFEKVIFIPEINLSFRSQKLLSYLVSIDTRSMQCLLQMFLPVTQSTLRSSVKSYSQEKK